MLDRETTPDLDDQVRSMLASRLPMSTIAVRLKKDVGWVAWRIREMGLRYE